MNSDGDKFGLNYGERLKVNERRCDVIREGEVRLNELRCWNEKYEDCE